MKKFIKTATFELNAEETGIMLKERLSIKTTCFFMKQDAVVKLLVMNSNNTNVIQMIDKETILRVMSDSLHDSDNVRILKSNFQFDNCNVLEKVFLEVKSSDHSEFEFFKESKPHRKHTM